MILLYYKSINYKTAEVDSLAVFGYSPILGLSLEEEELLGLFIIFVEILGNEKVHYSILVDTPCPYGLVDGLGLLDYDSKSSHH